ncbi:MAG: hypothetical protein M4579_002626 [Chaenotheca gracillima]|nr:MAG: hypothetical protein M4579_002626 [Chaenotheca gracillima]
MSGTKYLRSVALGASKEVNTRKLQRALSPVQTLRDGTLDIFRRDCWTPSVPGVLPKGQFASLSAVKKWFTASGATKLESALHLEYLSKYGDTVVPLELTRASIGGATDEKPDGDSFNRFDAPLSLFLEWSRSDSRDSLYLAQASLSDLPAGLRDDLPTPEIVAHAGRGDIYDSNIWIGRAPTYTPLHRDPNPNLFVQLVGKKTVRLFKPEVGAGVFAHVQAQLGRQGSAVFRGEEMMQGPERKLLEEAVWSEHAPDGFAVELEQGDGLFIPKGWWHSIKGVGSGITGSVRDFLHASSHLAYAYQFQANWWFR